MSIWWCSRSSIYPPLKFRLIYGCFFSGLIYSCLLHSFCRDSSWQIYWSIRSINFENWILTVLFISLEFIFVWNPRWCLMEHHFVPSIKILKFNDTQWFSENLSSFSKVLFSFIGNKKLWNLKSIWFNFYRFSKRETFIFIWVKL